MDLKSKYAEIKSIGSDGGIPMIILEATENTLEVDENNDCAYTEIQFQELGGWGIWANYLGRYMLNICFVKEED